MITESDMMRMQGWTWEEIATFKGTNTGTEHLKSVQQQRKELAL